MNASIQERLAQRRKGREERRQRVQEELKSQDERDIFFAAFGNPIPPSSTSSTRRAGLTKSTSAGHLFSLNTATPSTAVSQQQLLQQQLQQQPKNVLDTSMRGSIHSLKSPPKDTRTYNRTVAAPGAAVNRLSLPPPSKDTRPYNCDDATVNTSTTNHNPMAQDSRTGREPKRGNLQRHRSRSLTDLQRYTGAKTSFAHPKTPKQARASFVMATPRSAKRGIKSLHIAPTIIQPQPLLSAQPKPVMKRHHNSHSKLTDVSSSQDNTLEFNHADDAMTSSAADDGLPRMDPLTSPLSKKNIKKRISGGTQTVKSADAPLRSNTARAHKTLSSRQFELANGNEEEPSIPKRRSRGEHSLTPTTPSNRPIKRLSKLTNKANSPKKPASIIQRSKSDGEAYKVSILDDDDEYDDDDDVLFTPHRTPNSKGATRQSASTSAETLPHDRINVTSHSHSTHTTNSSSTNKVSSPIKATESAPASRWSMANPDQVTKWKSKLATPATSTTATASTTKSNDSANSLQTPRQRRRYSCSNATPTSLETSPSLEADTSDWFDASGGQESEHDKSDHDIDGAEFHESDNNIDGSAPPPLMDHTGEEQQKKQNGSNSKRTSLRQSKAQSMMNLAPITRTSFDKSNIMLNFESLSIMDDNARNDVARPRSSGASRKVSDAGQLTLSSLESNESRESLNASATSQGNGRSRSRSSSGRQNKTEDQTLQRTEHRRKSKDRNQNSSNKEESRSGGRTATQGKLQRHRSRSLSDLQDALTVTGDGLKVTPKTNVKRRDTLRAQPQLQASGSNNLYGLRKIKSSDPSLCRPENNNESKKADQTQTTPSGPEVSPKSGSKEVKRPSGRKVNSSDPSDRSLCNPDNKNEAKKADQTQTNPAGPELSPKSGNREVKRPIRRKVNSSDPKLAEKKTRESTRPSSNKGKTSDSKIKSSAAGEVTKREAENGRAAREMVESNKQPSVHRSKSPKESSRVARRGVCRTRSSSLSDLRVPRLDTTKLHSVERDNGHSDQFEQSTMTMNDSIPTIGTSSFCDFGHPELSSPEGTTKKRGPRKVKSQPFVSSKKEREKLEQSATMHDSIATSGSSLEGHVDSSSQLERKNVPAPRKQKLQRSRTEDCTTNHAAERRPSPARHPRPKASLVGPPQRPSLARHRSNSLSDLREVARSLRKSKVSSRRPSFLDTDEEEKDIERLKAEIETLEKDLKNVTQSPPRNFAEEKAHLEESIKKEQADQKALKRRMFDVYQDNVKLEEALEKTLQYYAELEEIHNAEVMKNEALLKNVPVFQKVIEAHEVKLARRTRYIDFECRTMQFYEDRIQTIIRSFQEHCTDAKLIKTLETMAQSTAPLADENDTVNTGATSVGSTASTPQQQETISQIL